MNGTCVCVFEPGLCVYACLYVLSVWCYLLLFLHSQRANAVKQGCRMQVVSLSSGLVGVLEQENHQTALWLGGVWRPCFRATLEEEQRSGSQHHWTWPNLRGCPGLITLPQAVHCRLANMEIIKKKNQLLFLVHLFQEKSCVISLWGG